MFKRLARAAVVLYAASVVATAVLVYVVMTRDPDANLAAVPLIALTLPTSSVLFAVDLGSPETFILLLSAIGLLQAAGLALLLRPWGTPQQRR